mmetsp:Transcript_13742/g.44882  ORF Transcript_13742/g.44882 Transcript_13742/m.44882 type:complete len:259 (+) Transcript_13742:184-960(+)
MVSLRRAGRDRVGLPGRTGVHSPPKLFQCHGALRAAALPPIDACLRRQAGRFSLGAARRGGLHRAATLLEQKQDLPAGPTHERPSLLRDGHSDHRCARASRHRLAVARFAHRAALFRHRSQLAHVRTRTLSHYPTGRRHSRTRHHYGRTVAIHHSGLRWAVCGADQHSHQRAARGAARPRRRPARAAHPGRPGRGGVRALHRGLRQDATLAYPPLGLLPHLPLLVHPKRAHHGEHRRTKVSAVPCSARLRRRLTPTRR